MSPYILTAILSLLATSSDRTTESARLEPLADAIATAVDDARTLPFSGDAGPEATAIALVAIASHESSFHPDVLDCRRRGDGGLSVTAFQLHRGAAWGEHTEAELCASYDLAARRALRVLTSYSVRAWSPAGVFSTYAGGERHRKAARDLCALWERLARQRGLAASCWGSRTITRIPSKE